MQEAFYASAVGIHINPALGMRSDRMTPRPRGPQELLRKEEVKEVQHLIFKCFNTDFFCVSDKHNGNMCLYNVRSRKHI